MESTGKYWIPVDNVLEDFCSICLVHPKYVKIIRGKKTDKKDVQWITDLFKHDLVAGSIIPYLFMSYVILSVTILNGRILLLIKPMDKIDLTSSIHGRLKSKLIENVRSDRMITVNETVSFAEKS